MGDGRIFGGRNQCPNGNVQVPRTLILPGLRRNQPLYVPVQNQPSCVQVNSGVCQSDSAVLNGTQERSNCPTLAEANTPLPAGIKINPGNDRGNIRISLPAEKADLAVSVYCEVNGGLRGVEIDTVERFSSTADFEVKANANDAVGYLRVTQTPKTASGREITLQMRNTAPGQKILVKIEGKIYQIDVDSLRRPEAAILPPSGVPVAPVEKKDPPPIPLADPFEEPAVQPKIAEAVKQPLPQLDPKPRLPDPPLVLPSTEPKKEMQPLVTPKVNAEPEPKDPFAAIGYTNNGRPFAVVPVSDAVGKKLDRLASISDGPASYKATDTSDPQHVTYGRVHGRLLIEEVIENVEVADDISPDKRWKKGDPAREIVLYRKDPETGKWFGVAFKRRGETIIPLTDAEISESVSGNTAVLRLNNLLNKFDLAPLIPKNEEKLAALCNGITFMFTRTEGIQVVSDGENSRMFVQPLRTTPSEYAVVIQAKPPGAGWDSDKLATYVITCGNIPQGNGTAYQWNVRVWKIVNGKAEEVIGPNRDALLSADGTGLLAQTFEKGTHQGRSWKASAEECKQFEALLQLVRPSKP